MNPLTNVRNVQKLNERELELGVIGKKSWHDEYKDSAWIFIGGLPYDLSEGDIVCVFSQYGEIVNFNLVRDHKTGKSKGYGFLCFEDQRSTILSVDNLNSIKILGRTIRVDHVKEYKIPKEHKNDDDLVVKLREEGCAPKIQESSEEEQIIPVNVKQSKKEKKKSKKSKKKKKRKESNSDSSSESDSDKTEDKNIIDLKQERCDIDMVDIKQERHDPGYEKAEKSLRQRHDRFENGGRKDRVKREDCERENRDFDRHRERDRERDFRRDRDRENDYQRGRERDNHRSDRSLYSAKDERSHSNAGRSYSKDERSHSKDERSHSRNGRDRSEVKERRRDMDRDYDRRRDTSQDKNRHR